MIDINELRQLAQAALAAPDGLSAEWMDSLGQFQEAADASVVSELLDRLESAESDAIEQARLNGVGASREAALMAKLEAAEKERDWNAERLEEAIEECTALRARIKAMEQQEPVACVWRCDNGHIHGSCEQTLPMGAKLYALPGAKGE